MKKRRDFKECTDKEYLFEIEDKDITLTKELLNLAKHRKEFFEKVKKESENYPSLFIESHYEIIKELFTAILAIDGWKALNHECLFAYIKERHSDLDLDFNYLLELKDTRNSIDYRGVMVSSQIWKENKLKIDLVINSLIKYIEGRIK